MWARRVHAHTAIPNNLGLAPRLLGGADVDPHADAVARLVGQLGHAAAAMVDVRDAVAVDTLLDILTVVRLATLRRVGTRRRGLIVAIATTGLGVADTGADDGARGGGRAAAVTMADLV